MKALAAAFFVLVALACLAPSSASAQDEWERQVRTLIRNAAQRFEADGYELTHEIFTGSLADDASDTVTLELEIGMSYYIVGACDTDCSDLDLILYDGAGNQIDSDMLQDDFPIVDVTPSRSGTFTVFVSMASCSVEPCRFGLGAFGK